MMIHVSNIQAPCCGEHIPQRIIHDGRETSNLAGFDLDWNNEAFVCLSCPECGREFEGEISVGYSCEFEPVQK